MFTRWKDRCVYQQDRTIRESALAITIGTRRRGKEIIYYAIVNGVVSKNSYTGAEGRRKALAEAAEIEFKELLKELASKEMAEDLAALPEGSGITITVTGDPAFRYGSTDAENKLSSESFPSRNAVVDHLNPPTRIREP